MITDFLLVIISAENWVCCCQNRCPRIQNCSNACLGHRYRLLFHSLVDSDSILRPHFIKLINAHDTTISQHEGPAFKLKLTSVRILDYGSGQTGSRRTLA